MERSLIIAKIVFIGPCTAKKAEAIRNGAEGSVDYVLTFEELLALYTAFGVNPYECEEDDVNDGSVFGRNFGMSGGLTAAIENYVKDSGVSVDFKPVKVSGLECKKTMTMAKAGRLPGNFIEGMMCEGGCIAGVDSQVANALLINGLAKAENEQVKSVTIESSKEGFEDIDCYFDKSIN